jgi:hypothetical protein
MTKESKLKHKKWEEEQKEKSGSLKKRVTCKGGKQHNFVLLVPPYYRRIGGKPLTPEQTLMFYELQTREAVFDKGQDEAYVRSGLAYSNRDHGVSYFYKCSVCGKEKYEYIKII